MTNIFIKPGPSESGVAKFVRDPESGVPLDVAGEWKPLTQFWQHRLRDRDVIEAAPISDVPARRASVKSTLPAPTPV